MAITAPSIQQFSTDRLVSISRNICEYGFNSIVLSEIKDFVKHLNDGTALFERIPQAQLSGMSERYGFLCEASIVCSGCPCTESELREIYCTDDLVNDGLIQQELIESWARSIGIWYDNPEDYLNTLSGIRDDGTESQVFISPEDSKVYKLISLKHYNVVRLALDRLIIHNALFPATYLKVFGFGKNENNKFVIMVEQPYVRGRGVTEEERFDFMMKMGFEEAGMDYGLHLNYKTDDLYVGDLNQFNVLKGESGIHVIDADCRLNVPTLGCGGHYAIRYSIG